MASITQDMKFRLSLIRYAQKYGVTNAAIKYKTNRHIPQEINLISDMRRRNPDAGLVIFWMKLTRHGYSRSIPGLYRFLKKQGFMAVHPPNPKDIPKPYEQMGHPGERIQIDVKLKNTALIPLPCSWNTC